MESRLVDWKVPQTEQTWADSWAVQWAGQRDISMAVKRGPYLAAPMALWSASPSVE